MACEVVCDNSCCAFHVCHVQVFYPGHSKPVFFVASRGHHADIGGITPGVLSC